MSSVLADPPRSRDDFEVAVICALAHEADAIIAVFDSHWDDSTHELRPSLSEDKNEYTFGRIGLHDVVVIVLPGMGKQEASSAAAAMHPTFRNIQLSLVVGVCAIVPYTEDKSEILLGDVVISTHVIQSDLGRQYEDTFIRKDTLEDNLAKSPQEIRRILKRLELEHHHQQLVQRMQGHFKQLQSRKSIYAYPGTESDQLYAVNYTHMHRDPEICTECEEVEGEPDHVCASAKSASCAELGCDTSQLVPRKRLSEPTGAECQASVWFGRFASGDQVLKSAAHREKLHKKEKVIGFEMEGSGAWEHFPTVIIKSGCDYADSHKSKTWQKYCAGSAAACTKAFLQEWRKKNRFEKSVDVPDAPGRALVLAPIATGPRVLPLRRSNPLFLGREDELAVINHRLSSTLPTENGMEPKIVAVQGLGGSGKSELCLRYLNLHESRYWAIFWIDGTTDKSLTSGFGRIASQLRLASDDVASVRYSLATQEQRWLLIIDNADDPDLDLSPFLPDQGTGHILITTRNPELDVFQTESALHLGNLAKDDALKLLFNAARTPSQEQRSLASGAKDIVEKLDFHTLAIIQAGAYIRRTRDLNGYIRVFNEQRKRVLDFCAPQARSQYGSVYATFEVSALKLRQDADERQQQSAADALDLLKLFAFMDTRGPFERIFRDARDFVEECTASAESSSHTDNDEVEVEVVEIDIDDDEGLTRRHSNLLTPLAYATNDLDGRYRWREACDTLHRYSLLSFEKDESGDEILSFHPIVLAWALARQTKEDYRASWFSVAATVFFSRRGLEDSDTFLSRLANHVRTCAAHVSTDWWTDTSNLPFLFLLYQLAWVLLLNEDDVVNATTCQCLEIGLEKNEREQSLWPSWLDSIQFFLGCQAYNVGDYSKSILLLEHVVRVQEQTLAETHSKRLSSQQTLAKVYRSNGQTNRAVQILEHVVEIRKQTLAQTDWRQLNSQEALAGSYLENGQIKEAVRLLEYVVQLQNQTLVETHSIRLAAQDALADAYIVDGQIHDGIQLFKHIIDIKEKNLPETHSNRLFSQHGLAKAYMENRQYQEAIQLLKYVVKTRARTLPETHPDRLASLQTLGNAYRENGQIQEAVQLLEHVVRVEARTLAETHPHRLLSQHTLSMAYQRNEQKQEAVQLLEHVVEVEARTLAETNPGRLASQYALGIAYHENRQSREAVQLLEHVVEVEARTLLDTDPDRLISQRELGIAYQRNGQKREAVRLLEHVVEVRARTLAETDPDRLDSESVLRSLKESLT